MGERRQTLLWARWAVFPLPGASPGDPGFPPLRRSECLSQGRWGGGEDAARSLRVPGSEHAENVTGLPPPHPDTAEFSGW